jgi:hypothetical protein
MRLIVGLALMVCVVAAGCTTRVQEPSGAEVEDVTVGGGYGSTTVREIIRGDGTRFVLTDIGDWEVWKDGEIVAYVSSPWVYDVTIDYVPRGMPMNCTDGTIVYSDGKGGYTREDPKEATE